jgi:hypothetical protein
MAELESLTSVRSIGGDLRLVDLDAVVVVDRALWLLEEVGEVHLVGWDVLQVLRTDALTGPFEPRSIVLSSLPSLQRVVAFNRVQVVSGDLVVTDNPALTELAGFDNLVRVTGDVVVTDNPLLSEAEIDAWLLPVEVDGEVGRADNGP